MMVSQTFLVQIITAFFKWYESIICQAFYTHKIGTLRVQLELLDGQDSVTKSNFFYGQGYISRATPQVRNVDLHVKSFIAGN